MSRITVDVAIIGGGPAGSTCACVLKKYARELRVLVLEREKFPRDHVGESQLPPISRILDEIGCWEKVEAANFPIKIGATYKWGKSDDLWDFEFYPSDRFEDQPRPAKYEGQRRWTAFQVDRAVYDEILLSHAAEMGTDVRQESKVVKVHRDGDKITYLELQDGTEVVAEYYVDASGHSGALRRAMEVPTHSVTSLQNVAFWDYWQNAEWAVNIGVGGTRVQVMSVGYGWIWFIPLGPTRTSVGLVLPARYYKESGKRPEQLYREALASEPNIAQLMKAATSEGTFSTTNDWSFMSERNVGENWFLAGEASGFADPILAAGLSLTHASAREAALSIIELWRFGHPAPWIRSEYDERQKSRLRAHIRFADYWYTANARFTDLKEFTAVIAQESGLDLTPDKAWPWLAQGGFVDYDGNLGIAGFSTDQILQLGEFIADIDHTPAVKTNNTFVLNLTGATKVPQASYGPGMITKVERYVRGDRVLPLSGVFALVVDMLSDGSTVTHLAARMKQVIADRDHDPQFINEIIGRVPHAIEAMVTDGWIVACHDPEVESKDLPERVANILHWNHDNRKPGAGSAG